MMSGDSSDAHGAGRLLQRRAMFNELVGGVEEYAIFMMCTTGEILSWNRGAALLKGFREDEIIGRNFATFYGEKERAAGIPAEELEVADGHGSFSTEGWRIRKDGSRFWAGVTITAIRTPDGILEGFLKITRDLTRREEATEALRQSEERLRLLIESVSEYAIFMLDSDGFVRSWNSGARRIKGYSDEEIIGQLLRAALDRLPGAEARGLPEKPEGGVSADSRLQDGLQLHDNQPWQTS